MLRHALRLIWNRKRANALIIVELALAFLIVFFMAGFGANAWRLWSEPLGFEWKDTLELRLAPGGQWTEDDGATLRQLLATVRDQPEVEWAHHALPPFRNWSWTTSVTYADRSVDVTVNRMTDGGPEDFGVELVEGRFFDETDAGPERIPVIIDEVVARTLFPGGFESGVDLRDHSDGDDPTTWPVVGVFRRFRQHGELSPLKPYVITRFPIEDPASSTPTIQVRVEAGTPMAFEERLQSLAESVAPSWNIIITPLSKLRQQQIRQVMVPLAVAFWISVFLLLMVAFGLFGVLWQSVTRRTDELGLRRALGAHRRRVYQLIVTETLMLALLASLLGCLIAVQFPIAAGFKALDWQSSLSGMLVGLVVLLGLAGLCSLYPAWLASRRSPAEALHYE
ncbi:MAG: FtsX-like permease family protein [Thermoanaerobaculia bacterium]|nr:FtsX-like permease family protein [Thermoanaerobaculia bacterium]